MPRRMCSTILPLCGVTAKKIRTSFRLSPRLMSDKINILFLSASPRDSGDWLRTDIELREVDKAIRNALNRDRFSIASCPAAERKELQDALLRHRPQIVHFSGHADSERGILLENEREGEAPVSGAALAGLFKALGGIIRIVVLNACNSYAAASAFQHAVEYTVAMQGEISDAAATVFTSAFYRALAYRKSPDEAFNLGLNALEIERIPEKHIPQLLVHPEVIRPPEPIVPEEAPSQPDGVDIGFRDVHGDAAFFFGNSRYQRRAKR